ncbi:uncharacterized protein LOC105848383 [Hydra vulgaris]|uniref:uncharacterized protein LOC105848383 n=1 Tax=Hydra vulgaris TaxID=6087 RepID=UPI0006411F69|nr:uncharacterized protein LOC105848383 [Hydra vulgaris]
MSEKLTKTCFSMLFIFILCYIWYLIMNIDISSYKVLNVGKYNMMAYKSNLTCPKVDTEFNKCILNITMNPPGRKSYIVIQSFDSCNNSKTIGGDFWWMKIIGPNSFNVPLIDNNNGFYYQEFWLNVEGNYTISLMLEFSKNDGMKDPPKDWFKYGDYQGRRQNEDYFGKNFDYILELKTFQYSVSKDLVKNNNEQLQIWHFQPFCIANNAHGYWQKNVYKTVTAKTDSTFKHEMILRNLAALSNVNNTVQPTFWFYGDSLNLLFFRSLKATPLCKLFICQNTYIWTYPVTNPENPNAQPYDNKDFNQTKFLDNIKMVLINPLMMNNNSVLIINFGLHILKNINMSQAKELLDGFLDMVLNIKSKVLPNFPKILWKSTTPAYIENFLLKHGKNNLERTLVKQRAIHWNLYCVKKMCELNIPVLDVYWMAASYPQGPYDAVHYDSHVFSSAATFLTNLFTYSHESF